MFYNGLGSILRGRGFEVVLHPFRKHPDAEIKLPTRSDNNSAGYDFYTPVDIVIEPQGRVLVWTDVKAYMQNDEVLMLYIRSSIGVKKGVVLSSFTVHRRHDEIIPALLASCWKTSLPLTLLAPTP